MRDSHLLGKFANGYPISPWKAFDSEERLILLRAYTIRDCCILTETEKFAERIAECRQQFIICLGQTFDGIIGRIHRIS